MGSDQRGREGLGLDRNSPNSGRLKRLLPSLSPLLSRAAHGMEIFLSVKTARGSLRPE